MIILSVLISLVKELVQPVTIYPHEGINRILKIIEEKQNGRCISCKQHITNKHVVVSSGRPRSYYHKDRDQASYNMTKLNFKFFQ